MFNVKETPTRKELLAYITGTAVANSDTDLNPLLELFNPGESGRDVMGPKFSEVLGYNPITHFDFQDVLAAIDRIRCNEADRELADDLSKMSNALAKRAMEIFDERRHTYLDECLAEAGMELLSRTKGEELSTLLIGKVLDDTETDDEDLVEGIDDVSLSLDGDDIVADDDEPDFGLEDDTDE